MIINSILSTDMANHKLDYEKLKILLNKDKESNNLFDNNENKMLICSQLIHISDISNPLKKFSIYKKWVDNFFEESFKQGDKEKECNLPISMLCDRTTTNIPDSQVFFINFFLKDHLELFVILNPKFNQLLEEVLKNIDKWKLIKKQNILY